MKKCMYLKVMHYVNNRLHGKKCVYGLGVIDAPSDVKNVFITYTLIFYTHTFMPLNILYCATYRLIVILNAP